MRCDLNMINPYESIVVDFPQSLQVCDPPPTSAVNVTLPAAAERRRQLSIDISCPRGARRSSKPAAGRCCCRLTGQTDGRTDGRTDAQPFRRSCSTYNAGTGGVNKAPSNARCQSPQAARETFRTPPVMSKRTIRIRDK